MLDRADAFVSNLAPGSTARLGLSPADLAESHPQCHPRRDRRLRAGRPDVAQARIRPAGPGRRRDRAPSRAIPDMPAKPGPAVADFTTGLYAALSILALLFSRDRRDGPAPAVALSLFDVMTDIMGYQLTYTQHSGIDQQPLGVGSPAVAPYGAFPTRDGQTVVLGTTNDREWQRLASEIIDRPDLADDPRFATNSGRCRAPRHPRRSDRILVCAARSRAHTEDRRCRGHRQLALQPAERGRGAPAADGARPLAGGRHARRARSRRCCRRRSSPATIRRWAPCPGSVEHTDCRAGRTRLRTETTSPRCGSRASSGLRFADAARETKWSESHA